MKCRRSEELFSDYLDGSLPIPLRADLEEHLKSCSECAPLMESFRAVVDGLGKLPRPEPSPDLVERILSATRGRLGPQRDEADNPTAFSLPARINWAVWAAAAAFVALVLLRPPLVISEIGEHVNRMGHQAYSYGLRAYESSARLIDELNVLRMTVGVAFEDRLDRLNERLKELEEARKKNDEPREGSGTLVPSLRLMRSRAHSVFPDSRSLT